MCFADIKKVLKISRYSELHRQRFSLREKNATADRKVPNQPNVFYGTDGKVSRLVYQIFHF